MHFATILLLLLLGVVLISRNLNAAAFHELPDDKKLELRTEFKSVRWLTTIPLILLGAAYLLLQSSEWDNSVLVSSFAIPFMLLLLFRIVWSHLQLRRFDLPMSYRRKFMFVQFLSLIALIIFGYWVTQQLP